MSADPISSLFILHTGPDVGYAISLTETLFYETGLELSGGDPERVHFSYRSLHRGHPRTLPKDFKNVIPFDFRDTNPGTIEGLAAYVATEGYGH